MKIERTSDVVNMQEESSDLSHCLVMKDQQVFEELENKWLFLNQHSTGISFLFLFLLPNMLSIDRQINELPVWLDSENFL